MRIYSLILAAALFATSAHSQSYSKVRQHVLEYDGVAGRLSEVADYLPTNQVAYRSELPAIGSNAAIATFVADATNGVPVTNTSVRTVKFSAGDNVLLSHAAGANESEVTVSASSAIAGPPGPAGAGGLVYAGVYDPASTIYTNEATLVSYGRATYYTTNKWPEGGSKSPTNTAYWSTFVPGGEDGDDGADGADGATGVGFAFVGQWSTNVVELTTNGCVSYDGRLFGAVSNLYDEAGIPVPVENGVVDTNSYYILVDKGGDGAAGSVSSNLYFYGAWGTGTNYPALSVVTYAGSSYYATEDILGPDYPIPGTDPWETFAAKGATGQKGDRGVDGIGNMQFMGFFSQTTLYPSNSVVVYGDRPNWYRAKALISGAYPTATSYWEKVLWSGLDGEVFGVGYSVGFDPSAYYPSNHWLREGGAVYSAKQPVTGYGNGPPNASYWELVVRDGTTLSTGLVWRGEWESGTYYSNDLVERSGSSYYVKVGETEDVPPSEDWGTFVAKGDTGPQGPAGEDGTASVFNVYYQTNLTILTQNVYNVTNNSYTYTTNLYDQFISYTSILNQTYITNQYTNLGVTSGSAYRGDWGASVSNRADQAYLMAEAASTVAGATNIAGGTYDALSHTLTPTNYPTVAGAGLIATNAFSGSTGLSLDAASNLVVSGATAIYFASPTTPYTLGVAATAPSRPYALWIYSTNAMSLTNGYALTAAWTATVANLVVLTPTGSVYRVTGRGY